MGDSTSNISKPRSKVRRLSHTISTTNSLRDTLSAFGDDVVKVKDQSHLPSLITGGYMPQEGVNPSENYFSNNFDILSPSQQDLKFERIPSSEVGVRSSRWTRAIIAGVLSSKISRNKGDSSREEEGQGGDEELDQDGGSGSEQHRPPFWGVPITNRDKVPTLRLQLLLHEFACFASCVLLGCLIIQALEGLSWIKQSSNQENWFFSRLYGTFTTFLLVFTLIGFLLRVDTTEKGSLFTLPLFLLPTILLSSSSYLNKAWELQREECSNYFKMNEILRLKVHLTQDCSFYKDSLLKQTGSNFTAPEAATVIIMRICPAIACFIIAVYMFIFRDTFYMIGKFSRNIFKK